MSTVAVEQALALPANERGRILASISEDQWFDRKSARIKPQDLADVLVGFANADGGTVVIGLWNGQVEGVRDEASISGWQQAAIDFTVPVVRASLRTVDCVNEAGEPDRLVVFDIDPSDHLHANRRDDVYLRVGDENRRLTFSQRQELLYDKGQASFEATTVDGARTADLDSSLLGSYAAAVNHPDVDRLLVARGLMKPTGDLTAAAVLLFANEPQRWFPEASLRVLRYQGKERGSGARQQLLADERIDGPIPHLLQRAREIVQSTLPTRRALSSSGTFEKVGLLPQDAWLEAMVNAVVHRSYSLSGDHIRVEIFDDRIEVQSPGRFPGIADAGDPLKVTRFARNPRIARVCADLRFGQELGEGIRRMFEEMRLAGLADPEYYQSAGSVRLTLLTAPIDRALEARLPKGSRDLVRLVREAGHVSTGDLTAATHRSRPVVIEQLKALERAGILRWVGNSPKDPRAYWMLRLE